MGQVETPRLLPNPMQRLSIGKVVINITVGKSGEPLQRAMKVLEQLVDQKPSTRKAKKTIRDWGVRKGEPIACNVTIRHDRAVDFLKKAFDAVGNRLSTSSFDSRGNFSFGIREHIEIPGVKYDPALGIFGMDVCVNLVKPGYNVEKRRRLKARIGKRHEITSEEAVGYIKSIFNIQVE